MDYIIFFNVVLKDLVNFLSITAKTFLNACQMPSKRNKKETAKKSDKKGEIDKATVQSA